MRLRFISRTISGVRKLRSPRFRTAQRRTNSSALICLWPSKMYQSLLRSIKERRPSSATLIPRPARTSSILTTISFECSKKHRLRLQSYPTTNRSPSVSGMTGFNLPTPCSPVYGLASIAEHLSLFWENGGVSGGALRLYLSKKNLLGRKVLSYSNASFAASAARTERDESGSSVSSNIHSIVFKFSR